MHPRLFLAATLVILPGVAAAQRGGSSRAGVRTPVFEKENPALQGPALRPRDIEDQSPIRLLIDKRKDLKLSDAQVDGLKQSDNKLKERNAPLLKAVDSLVHEMRPPLNMTDEATNRIRDARDSLQETLKSVAANYDAAAKDALATFDPDQQKKATELLDKLREESAKVIREKLGTRQR